MQTSRRTSLKEISKHVSHMEMNRHASHAVKGTEMRYIERLPFILGAVAGLVAGLLSYKQNIVQNVTYVRMAISMSVFFVLGVFVRGMLLNIKKELDEKSELEEKEERERIKQQEMEAAMAAQAANANAEDEKGGSIDLRIGESSEQFVQLRPNELYEKSK